MIVGMCHVGMSVACLETSIAFYRAVLGMDVIVQGEFGGERYVEIMRLEGATGRAALLRGADLELEMFEFAYPRPRAPDPQRPVSDIGITHFCVKVSDIDACYAKLKSAAVVCHGPPVDFSGEAKALYARDPDGNVIEFLQPAAVAAKS